MATVAGHAVIPVSADLSHFQRDVQAGTQQATGGLKSFAKNAGAILGGAFAVQGAFTFAKGVVDAASTMNETVSKSRTIFGDQGKAIEKWADTAAKGFGQSKQQALDAAATFGNLFVQLGIGSKPAAAMSQQMVELASDFASFHNANPEDVINAQTAAFRGEYDALQRFVPTINAAAVEQEALRKTGKKTTKELTLQEKALAVQALMMKGAGDATGDFSRTSDSLANKQRIASAQWADMQAKIGAGVLPIITKLAGFLSTKLLPAMLKLGNFISDNKSLFVALGIGIAAVLVPAFITWAGAAATAAAATLLAIAPAVAVGLAVAGLAYIVIKNWDTIKGAIGTAVEAIKGFIGGLIDKFSGVIGSIGGVMSGVAGVITGPFKSAFNAIARLWNNTVGKLSFKIPGWVPGIGGKGFDVPDIPTFGGGDAAGPTSPRNSAWGRNIPSFHTGGVVPGRPGQEVLSLLQAGETVTPTGQSGGRPIQIVNNISQPDDAWAGAVSRQIAWGESL